MQKNDLHSLQNDLRNALNHMVRKDEKLIRAEFTLTSILDAIHHPIILVDELNEIKFINTLAKRQILNELGNINTISGFVQCLVSNSLVSEKDKEKLQQLLEQTLEDESFITDSIKITIKRKTEKCFLITTAPIYDDELGFLGRIWQFEDVTLKERINEMKIEFLSIASHQLRTPLASIRGYTDMLENGDYGDFNPEAKEALSAIAIAGRKMSNLLDDLLNISRLEDGKFSKVNFEEVDLLEDIVNPVIEEQKKLAENKSQEILLNANLAETKFITDKIRLKESLSNLLQNAIKYSGKGKKITININKQEEKLRIEVIDQGVGIPVSEHDKIFQKFFRAENVLTENFDGTGLGLYYVKKAISDLGGSVDFDSEEGKGTTFKIVI
jgi:signal transduction histidine kinase